LQEQYDYMYRLAVRATEWAPTPPAAETNDDGNENESENDDDNNNDKCSELNNNVRSDNDDNVESRPIVHSAQVDIAADDMRMSTTSVNDHSSQLWNHR